MEQTQAIENRATKSNEEARVATRTSSASSPGRAVARTGVRREGVGELVFSMLPSQSATADEGGGQRLSRARRRALGLSKVVAAAAETGRMLRARKWELRVHSQHFVVDVIWTVDSKLANSPNPTTTGTVGPSLEPTIDHESTGQMSLIRTQSTVTNR